MFAEVPSSRWLVSRLGNLFYRLSGSDCVANLSPMHAPYHLYEFTPRSFQLHGASVGYVVADHRHFVCHTYLPRPLSTIMATCMGLTNTGMQFCIWLRKTT